MRLNLINRSAKIRVMIGRFSGWLEEHETAFIVLLIVFFVLILTIIVPLGGIVRSGYGVHSHRDCFRSTEYYLDGESATEKERPVWKCEGETWWGPLSFILNPLTRFIFGTD